MPQIMNQSIQTYRNVFMLLLLTAVWQQLQLNIQLVCHIQDEKKLKLTGMNYPAPHTKFKYSNAQWTFKSVSTGLMRHIKELKSKEKNSNSLNDCLLTSALIQLPGSHE